MSGMDGERGVALVFTLLVVLVVGALVTGAAVLGSDQYVVSRYFDRGSNLEAVADAGLELARVRLNADASLFPESGYAALESGAAVADGGGEEIPGVTRSVYVGPTGPTAGRGGVSGSIVAVAEDEAGARVVRRQRIVRQSFARYARFTDAGGGAPTFAGGERVWGPVHSNDAIVIDESGADFHDEVTTHREVRNPGFGTFREGYEEGVPAVPMPGLRDLRKLEAEARRSGTYIEGDAAGDPGTATTRIEFVAVDLNGDGDRTDDDEGFLRVYRSDDPERVVAREGRAPEACPPGEACSLEVDLRDSESCGGTPAVGGDDAEEAEWRVAAELEDDEAEDALAGRDARCYLAGDEALHGGEFRAEEGGGRWLRWGGSVAADVRSARPGDAAHLFPVNRARRPDFNGVIFVDGKVAVSGELRGRVTLAASDEIVLADDLTYATDAGAGLCEDGLGLFSGGDVVVAENALNAPLRPWSGEEHRTYDDTRDEFIHATVLALGRFAVQGHARGPADAEPCEGEARGRGCLYLTGGVIQGSPAPAGTDDGTGYLTRYSYDRCAARRPPPHFPTTGAFNRAEYYQVEAAGFDIDEYWTDLTRK